MKQFYWSPGETDKALNQVLQTLAGCGYPLQSDSGSIKLSFRNGKEGELKVRKVASGYEITGSSISTAMRGISFALAETECDENIFFTRFGFMLDCSRNKVFTIEFLKKYFLQAALFGYNHVMLYTEDTYCLPNEPFFGYMRGGYTLEELQELDEFCAGIGVELSACIQTLGHMEHVMQWDFAYKDIMETPNVMLAGEEKSYILIEKMLSFWSKALRSREIHLGMDEAHDLGRGRNFDLNPQIPPQELFHRHLDRVNELCGKYGYSHPMIWSDMYFRLSNLNHKYYGCDTPLPEDVSSRIPRNVRLCYWDYYHETPDFYDKYIDFHRALGSEPVMFSGLWIWAKFWYDHQFTEKTIRPCIQVCRKKKLRELYFTMWGDDGAYGSFNSVLAGMCFAADLANNRENDPSIAARFAAVTGMDYELFMAISQLEYRVIDDPEKLVIGDAASLLWDDPLLAINFRGLRKLKSSFPEELDELLSGLLKKLAGCRNFWSGNEDVEMIFALIDFLRDKYRWRMELEDAYTGSNMKKLYELHDQTAVLQQKMRCFMDKFRTNWLACAKRFGLEVGTKRNAGQLERLREAEFVLQELISGKISSVPELDASVGAAAIGYQRIHYRHLASGSFIK